MKNEIETKAAVETAAAADDDVILEVKDLVVQYVVKKQVVEAVNGISFKLKKGKAIGLVGETGAGKTTTALALLNLVPDPPGIIKNGTVTVCGNDMLSLTPARSRRACACTRTWASTRRSSGRWRCWSWWASPASAPSTTRTSSPAA